MAVAMMPVTLIPPSSDAGSEVDLLFYQGPLETTEKNPNNKGYNAPCHFEERARPPSHINSRRQGVEYPDRKLREQHVDNRSATSVTPYDFTTNTCARAEGCYTICPGRFRQLNKVLLLPAKLKSADTLACAWPTLCLL